MRALLVATLVIVAAMAGCTGKKGDADDELHYECDDGTEIHADDYEGVLNETASDEDVLDFLKTKCKATGTGTGSKSGSTSLAPNKLPILVMKVMDFGGNETKVTMLDGNLTFDATGSSDPDGQVSAIAISVTDSNTTRTKALYDGAKKAFTPATFTFDRPGIVNVTVAMVDDRAGFNNSVFQVYVNHEQVLDGATISGVPGGIPDNDSFTHPCTGAQGALEASGSIVDAQYFDDPSFTVVAGASFIEAIPGEDTLVTICSPDRSVISDDTKSADPITSNNAEQLPAPPSTENYFLGLYAAGPNTESSATVIVHYEPREAAPAA